MQGFCSSIFRTLGVDGHLQGVLGQCQRDTYALWHYFGQRGTVFFTLRKTRFLDVASSMVLDLFKEYVTNAKQNFLELRRDEVTAIRLMHTLMRKKATLDTYDEVME